MKDEYEFVTQEQIRKLNYLKSNTEGVWHKRMPVTPTKEQQEVLDIKILQVKI